MKGLATAKISILILLVLIIQACVSAPSDGGSSNANPTRTSGRVRIGFSMDTLKEERWNKDHDSFLKRCEELGATCEVLVANESSEKQTADVEQLLTKGIDVLVLVPHDAIQAVQIVERAKSQGVPVISYDRLVNSEKIDLYISHQIPVVGRMIAEYTVAKVPKGKYVMVYGSNTDNNAKIIKDEQLKVIQPFIDKGEVKIVAEQFIPDWRPELALNFAENALTQNGGDVQAFVVSNDGMASGVIQALEKRGLAGKVIVTGQDAQLNALQSIAEGKQSMTVYKPIKPLAFGAVEAAMKIAEKELVPSAVSFDAQIDGKGIKVQALLIDVFSVEKGNLLETVIKDGHANFDDVFRNVPETQRPKR